MGDQGARPGRIPATARDHKSARGLQQPVVTASPPSESGASHSSRALSPLIVYGVWAAAIVYGESSFAEKNRAIAGATMALLSGELLVWSFPWVRDTTGVKPNVSFSESAQWEASDRG